MINKTIHIFAHIIDILHLLMFNYGESNKN